ncbi:DUF6316 family protein [Hahella aquimaris]|uniref:DUF6316 family protein n=1 Tax=Hahella sp. HNIBRBA332 TaxID=3015983 RepID=UPI00273B0447|nr:DUF6316 family protein [Hahella sp. HNIBRBA332]WLQ14038.1 DUF6316 family protein [Hahella sp. HNIBRBA332]
MDTTNRRGEDGLTPFRSDRFFAVGDKWYFSTREGFDSGPYAAKERAEEGLRRFLKVAQILPGEGQAARVMRAHRIF